MEFRRVKEVPSPGAFSGFLSKYTIECMEKLSELDIGEIFWLPLSEISDPVERKVQIRKYGNGIHGAKKKLEPRVFTVNRRGEDLYVKRKA